MPEPETELETERLILRLPEARDFDAYAAYMADEPAAKFIGGPQARPIAWRGFASLVGAWQLSGFSFFSVIDKRSGE